MRIAFFGLPLAALLLANDGHELVFAGICREQALGTRRLIRALGRKRVAIKPDIASDVLFNRLQRAAPELLVSWFWTTRIPPRLLSLAPRGAFGVHPSILPRHRGPDPYYWAIASGDDATGVTAHVLEADYDTGPMLGRRTLAIDPSWSAWTLAKKLDRPSLALLRDVVRAFAEGRAPAPEPQDERLATAAPAPDDHLLALHFRDPAALIVRRVRAASPWPGAFTEIGEVMVAITRARATSDFPRALVAGEATVRADGIVVVRARDDAVELLEGRIEDDSGAEVILGARELATLVRAATEPASRNV